MNKLLLLFLSLSVSGSLLALILFALSPVVKRRLSQTWQYYIWLVVVLRFLLPFSPETSFIGEIPWLVQRLGGISAVAESGSAAYPAIVLEVPDAILPPVADPDTGVPELPAEQNWSGVGKKSMLKTCVAALLTVALLCGFAGMGVYREPDNEVQPASAETGSRFFGTVKLTVENSNVTVRVSEDGEPRYEYDPEMFSVLYDYKPSPERDNLHSRRYRRTGAGYRGCWTHRQRDRLYASL